MSRDGPQNIFAGDALSGGFRRRSRRARACFPWETEEQDDGFTGGDDGPDATTIVTRMSGGENARRPWPPSRGRAHVLLFFFFFVIRCRDGGTDGACPAAQNKQERHLYGRPTVGAGISTVPGGGGGRYEFFSSYTHSSARARIRRRRFFSSIPSRARNRNHTCAPLARRVRRPHETAPCAGLLLSACTPCTTGDLTAGLYSVYYKIYLL